MDRNTGRFHTFEASRKELIMEFIFRLRDSRYNAVKRLKEKYGIFIDEEEKQGEDSGKRLSKMVERVVGAAKRGKVKSRWLMHDRALVTELVEETMELHTCLNSLTSLSINFLVAHFTTLRDAQPLESGLTRLESQVKEQVQNRSRAASQLQSTDTKSHRWVRRADKQNVSRSISTVHFIVMATHAFRRLLLYGGTTPAQVF